MADPPARPGAPATSPNRSSGTARGPESGDESSAASEAARKKAARLAPAGNVNRPLAGALYMLGATTCFAVMAVCIRYLKGDQTAIDITFWRALFGTAVTLPFILRRGVGIDAFRTSKLGLLTLRAFCTYVAMAAYFFALAHMDMVDAVALNATIPLFTAILAALMLPEVVGMRRWVATIIGFVGVLIVLRPGFQEIGLPALLAVGSAAVYAMAGVLVKILSRTETTTRIVFYMNLIMLLIAIVPWAIHWNMPKSWEAVGLLVIIGVAGTLAHVCTTRALTSADASFIAPFDFWRLFLVAIAGWLIFDEPGSVWTWAGGVIIFGSAIYITRREHIRARAAAAAASAGSASAGSASGASSGGRSQA